VKTETLRFWQQFRQMRQVRVYDFGLLTGCMDAPHKKVYPSDLDLLVSGGIHSSGNIAMTEIDRRFLLFEVKPWDERTKTGGDTSDGQDMMLGRQAEQPNTTVLITYCPDYSVIMFPDGWQEDDDIPEAVPGLYWFCPSAYQRIYRQGAWGPLIATNLPGFRKVYGDWQRGKTIGGQSDQGEGIPF
jgi:hypothetical protein